MNYYYENDNQYPNEFTQSVAKITGLHIGFGIFLLIWIFMGIVAFIMSLVCFAKSGTLTDKFLVLLEEFILGPFYFIFFALNKDYCR